MSETGDKIGKMSEILDIIYITKKSQKFKNMSNHF